MFATCTLELMYVDDDCHPGSICPIKMLKGYVVAAARACPFISISNSNEKGATRGKVDVE